MNSQSIAPTQPGDFEAPPHEAHHRGRRGIGTFLGHVTEMTAAMMIGMALVGMPLRAFQGAVFGASSLAIPEVRASGMAVSMTIAMVAWMRIRGHSSRASAEMGAAMLVPTMALLPLSWGGIISGSVLLGLGHVVMLPAMLAVMLYRRRDYGL
jgi:flagellar biosynthetic protein FliP